MKRNDVRVCLKVNSKNIYNIKIPSGMNCIHDNQVNNIAECNLLHDTLNDSKCTKM